MFLSPRIVCLYSAPEAEFPGGIEKNLILRKVMTISLGKYTGLSMTKALAPTWWLTGYNRLSVLNVAVLLQEVQLRVVFLIRWL